MALSHWLNILLFLSHDKELGVMQRSTDPDLLLFVYKHMQKVINLLMESIS